jgi:hypothetical protein
VAARYGFGIRYASMGVVEFIDYGGLDILYYASHYLAGALGEPRFAPPAIVDRSGRPSTPPRIAGACARGSSRCCATWGLRPRRARRSKPGFDLDHVQAHDGRPRIFHSASSGIGADLPGHKEE